MKDIYIVVTCNFVKGYEPGCYEGLFSKVILVSTPMWMFDCLRGDLLYKRSLNYIKRVYPWTECFEPIYVVYVGYGYQFAAIDLIHRIRLECNSRIIAYCCQCNWEEKLQKISGCAEIVKCGCTGIHDLSKLIDGLLEGSYGDKNKVQKN